MKRIIPIIIVVAAIAGGYWWYSQSIATALAPSSDGRLVGSGSIEAETVAITAELGGRIIKLHAGEGDEVEAGELLVELDQSDLLARQIELEAAVETARTNLELASASALPEDVALAEAQLSQAEAGRDGAALVSQRAWQLVNDPHELEARINQMKAQVTEAEKNLEMARVSLKRAEIEAEAASRDQSDNVGLAQDEAAQFRLEAARRAVSVAEVSLAGAQTQVEHLIGLRDRPLKLIAEARAAEAALHQAEAAVLAGQANLVAAKADPTPEDVNVARARLQEAESALAIVEVQLDKQRLTAPRAGLISKKLANAGELATPGAVLLELSDIETVDLTVYIPETQIGRVKIGNKATVNVDAYPGETFEGRVTFIAHEAEFTPRNVQTKEERVNLVFAVKITLDNADHRLKPGMPADAEILSEMWDGQTPAAVSEDQADALSLPAAPAESVPPTPAAEPVATPIPPTPTPQVTTTTAVGQAKVLAWGLKVRQGPGIGHPVLGHLSQGDVVSILERDPATGWLKIEFPDSNQTGWITNSNTFVSVQ